MKKALAFTLWLIVFFGGLLFSLLYVQGVRFEFSSKELVETGVLEISSEPDEALIFLNNVLSGKTTNTFRGYPLGPVEIRLEKTEFKPFLAHLNVEKELITRLRRVILLPLQQEKWHQIVGPEQNVFWDPEYRGYALLHQDQKELEIVDLLRNSRSVLEFASPVAEVGFDSSGNLEVFSENQAIFNRSVLSERFFNSWEKITAQSVFSPESDETVSFQGKDLLIRNTSTKRAQVGISFPEAILGAWWLSGSDDILVVSQKEIALWNRSLHRKRQILQSEAISSPVFVPDQEQLFYKNGEMWESISIGLE